MDANKTKPATGTTEATGAKVGTSGSRVYFVEAVGLSLVKIGFARDISERMRKLAPGCPVPLQLLGTVLGGATKERDFHVELHKLHAHGEWFRRGPALDAILATIDPPEPLTPRPMKWSRRVVLENTETAAQIAARL